MTVKEIIGTCLEKMGMTNFVNDSSYTVEETKLIDKLLVALNVAYRGTACDYLPKACREKVVVSDGEILAENLNKVIVHPISLTDDKGFKHSYSIYPDLISTDFSGEGVLEYAYLPSRLALTDTVDDMRMTADMISDGALSEYYFSMRALDLASAYDEQFRSKLTKAKYKGREIILKARRWGD